MANPLRPIALNDLPYPSQVRLEAPEYKKTFMTLPEGRAGFPDVPGSMTKANLFIEAAGQDGVGAPGFEWYGEVIDVPPDPQNDWWAVPIPEAYPRPLSETWYQLPKLLVPKPVVRPPTEVGLPPTDVVRPPTLFVRPPTGVIRPPIARTPLPALDRDTTDPETGAALPVHTRINGVIPPLEDDTYHRANLWGVTIEGAPFIDGGARGAAQNRLLTYLIDRYPRDWQARWLDAYAARGYRHFWTSIPDSRDRTRLSLAEYLDLTKRTLDAGLLPCHFLRSKDYDGKNPDPARVVPWVDALLDIGGIHTASHAWEASLMYDPPKLRETIDHDARRWPQIRWGVHLQQAYADFGPDGKDHSVDFWKKNIAVGVKLLLYQYKTSRESIAGKLVSPWSGGMIQARGNDISVRLIRGGLWGLPETVDWVPFEVVAQLQFNNETDGDGRLADENIGDLKGFETLCTPGPLPPRGFGNGARHPDGKPI